MRKIYIVRHGEVAFENNIKRCIGLTNVPLNDQGIQDMERVQHFFDNKEIEKVYCSSLDRSIHSANIISNGRFDIEINDAFIEMDMGEWENVCLKDINKTLTSLPEHGESREHALDRFKRGLEKVLKETSKDIVITSHAGVICCFLSYLLNSPLETSRGIRQPYGSINIIDENMEVISYGEKSGYPSMDEINRLYQKYKTPVNVIKHCQKVKEVALKIHDENNLQLDAKLIESACLLHDLVRYEKNHATKGYEVLIKEGYLKIAEIIKVHHELIDETINEATLVYYADKCVYEDQIIDGLERFKRSLIKCKDDEALKAHQRRMNQFIRVHNKLKEGETYETN